LNFPTQDALITTSNTHPLQHNSPPSLDSTQTGIISNTLSPVSATLPSFSIPNPSISDYDYLPLFSAKISPNINTPTNLSISKIHYAPSHFTSPPHINTTPVLDHISPDFNLEPHLVSASPTQQPDLTSTLPQSSQIITRSQTNSSKPKHFQEYHLYHSTKHPLQARFTNTLPSEPTTFKQAARDQD
jgi:hypothetical protein